MIILILLIMVMPAVPLLVWGLVPDYWGVIHLYWGIAFAILSVAIAFFLIRNSAARQLGSLSAEKLFYGGIAAWVFSVLVLAMLNSSSMCLGQDNGDGHNSVGMCVFLTLIWPVYLSLFVVPLIWFSSWLSVKILPRESPVKSSGTPPGSELR